MATVMTPINPRRYNHNPRGSATTQVTMAAHNPFEQRTTLVNRSGTVAQLAGIQPSGALPGMGMFGGSHLGDTTDDGSADPATMAAAAQYAAATDAAIAAQTPAQTAANDAPDYDIDAAAQQAQQNVSNAGGTAAQQTAAYYAALSSGASTSQQAVAAGQSAASNSQMVAAAQASLNQTGGAGSPAFQNTVAAAAKPAASGINWNSIFSTAVTGAGTTGAALINAKYGKQPAKASTPLAQIANSSMTPWIIGGVGVLGLVLLLTMHKK